MKLHFLGANRQVTGSRYCLETSRARVMVDCGLFQEREYAIRNWDRCPISPRSINAMLLTHIHIDHSGLLPRAVRQGLKGKVYATKPTVALAETMLLDAAGIQEEEASYKRKRHRREGRQGRFDKQVLFDKADVRRTLTLFKPVDYGQRVDIADGITAIFHDAGHILGSAILEVFVRDGEQERRIVFSGDIGQWGKPLIRDPTLLTKADAVVMESTYGDRDHEEGGDIGKQLETILVRTLGRGGNVVIPTFAVERAQELMYYIGVLAHEDRIPDVKVFLDSPMAVDVTDVFRSSREVFDDETWERINGSMPPLRFPGLKLCRSSAQSKEINEYREPCVIMSTSGMCTAGRIKHHLRRNITRPESTVLFVGYQGRGTLGRRILGGDSPVRIHGRNYDVKCEIAQVFGFSGHGDRSDLLRWLSSFDPLPRQLFLTHGEERSAEALAATIQEQFGFAPVIPHYHETHDIL